MDGDPLIVSLLQHERARQQTFSNWPPNCPEPHCMAFAGFHQVGDLDQVHCVFCQGVVQGWKRDDDPVAIHKNMFPHCPLVSGGPVANMGSTVRKICCRKHPNAMGLKHQRRRPEFPAATYRSYVAVLITLLITLGIQPAVTDTLVTVASATTMAPSPVEIIPQSIFTPVK